MTDSETLRAMLKERGIKYKTRDALGACETSWCGYTAYQLTPESKLIMHPTPEQAIAATVGNGTDLSKRLREVTGLHAFAELFGFDWHDESDWDWHDVACVMADAIDATVGVGTCHMRLAYEEEDADGCIWPDHYECDACGAKVNGIMLFYDTEIPPKYCPNCRREVVSE